MRFYTKQHQFYGGIDLHARTLYLCILTRGGDSGAPEHAGGPRAISQDHRALPDRSGRLRRMPLFLVLAGRPLRSRRPSLGLGQALSMKASHGGKAKHDTRDAPKIAVLLMGCYPRPMAIPRRCGRLVICSGAACI